MKTFPPLALPLAIAAITLAAPAATLAQAAPAQVTAAKTASDLAAVQRHLQSLTTMTADFSQADRAGKVLTGTFTLKQPGKLRFQYQQGVPILIVAEGGALTFVDYSVNQVQRWPIKNSPLGVVLDPTRDITRFARIVPGGDDRVVSVEAKDPKHPEYGRITLVFVRSPGAPAGLMLQGWVQLDSQSNRTTVRFTNQKFGGPVSDGAFRWNDPRKRGGRN